MRLVDQPEQHPHPVGRVVHRVVPRRIEHVHNNRRQVQGCPRRHQVNATRVLLVARRVEEGDELLPHGPRLHVRLRRLVRHDAQLQQPQRA